MIVGGLVYGPLLKRILSSTKAYSYDNIVLAVPNPIPYSSFETLFFPFTVPMWTLISIMLAIAVTVIKVLECYNREYYEFVVGSKNTSPYLNLIKVLLTGGAFNEPKGSFARYLLILWIITSVVLQTVYQGQLFSFIKMNKMKASVKSIDELIERRISIKLIKENYATFLKFDERLVNLNL